MNSTFPSISKSYKTHIIIWLIFIAYETLVIIVSFGSFPAFGDYFSHLLLNILLFYFHAELFYKIKSKYWLLPLLIIAEIFLYCVLSFSIDRLLTYLKNPESGSMTLNWMFVSRTLWRGLYFVGFSTGFVYILKGLDERKQAEELRTQNLLNTLDNQRLENELIKVENSFLRSQINPHFLFNTLSYIYNEVRKSAPGAAEAVTSLSDMMRYALKQPGSSETVPLSAEIEQVDNLIGLYRMRTKNKSFIDFNISGSIGQVRFLPLILLTLVENVFKHGNLTNSDRPAKINIDYHDGVLTLSTENLISDKPQNESNHVGIENIHKRLESFYKDKATLSFSKKEPNSYYTELKIRDI